jgi:hypothetical protein
LAHDANAAADEDANPKKTKTALKKKEMKPFT